MRIRIIGAVVAAAAAMGLFAIIVFGFAFNGAIANPVDDSDSSTVGLDQPANTDPEPELLPPTDDEMAVIDAHGDLIDGCMADAGFPEYVATTVWDPDFDPTFSWDDDLSEAQQQAAFDAMWGDTGAGADYHWDEAGCSGYATHMLGLDNAN